jgi:hypothetical protein
MKKILIFLYSILLLTIGTSISVYFVSIANSSHPKVEKNKLTSTIFPNYIKIVENSYESFNEMSTHFHSYSANQMTNIENHSNCLNCHSPFPHEKDIKHRTFNNQHFRFLSCETCHISNSDLKWFNFGIDNSVTKIEKYGINENSIITKENFISKITPVVSQFKYYNSYNDKDKIISKDSPEYHNFRENSEENLSKAKTCMDCHQPNSDFPWSKLGFSPEKIENMENNVIVNMVTKYETFHFPKIYE